MLSAIVPCVAVKDDGLARLTEHEVLDRDQLPLTASHVATAAPDAPVDALVRLCEEPGSPNATDAEQKLDVPHFRVAGWQVCAMKPVSVALQLPTPSAFLPCTWNSNVARSLVSSCQPLETLLTVVHVLAPCLRYWTL